MASLELTSIEPPYKGMDTETAPDMLERGYAQDVTNLLPGTPGRAPLRSGINHVSAELWTPATLPSGIWINASSTMLVGRAGNTTLKKVPSNFVTNADVTATSDQIPADAHAAVGDTVYGISTTGKFVRWNGSTTLTTYTNAPTDGTDLTYYLNRLWYLGGKAVGGSNNENGLFWSDQVDNITSLADAATSWQDDVSALTNRILLPFTQTNELVGFGRLPNALVIFGSQHGHLMLGSTIDSLVMRPRAVQHGCVDKRSIVEYQGGVMWMASDGFYYYDGAQEIELSTNIRSTLTAQIGENYDISATRLPHDYIMVTIGGGGFVHTWLLHVPTRSWVRFDSAAFDAYIVCTPFVATSGDPVVPGAAFDGTKFWKVSEAVYFPLGLYEGEDSANDVVGTVVTKILTLASPLESAQLNRVIFDARARQSTAYSLTIKTGTAGNSTLTTVTGNVGASAGDLDRVVSDLYREATEVEVTAELTASSGHSEAPEVRDLHMVHQASFQQASF